MAIVRKQPQPEFKKLKTLDMEMALAEYFGIRRNLVVPNVSWGMFAHECDLLVLSKAGYATEVEIKVSKSDLLKDKKKKHGHYSSRIKALYFAMPDYMAGETEHVPQRAGIMLVGQDLRVRVIRSPKTYSAHKFSAEERYQVARLGAMRIWGLKRKLNAK